MRPRVNLGLPSTISSARMFTTLIYIDNRHTLAVLAVNAQCAAQPETELAQLFTRQINQMQLNARCYIQTSSLKANKDNLLSCFLLLTYYYHHYSLFY